MRTLLVFIVLAVILAGAVEWALSAWDVPAPVARVGNETVILIPVHSRTRDVARMLEDKGTVKNALLFEFDARLKGYASRFKAGEYGVASAASISAIASILAPGKSIQHKLRVAEGLTSAMAWALVKN